MLIRVSQKCSPKFPHLLPEAPSWEQTQPHTITVHPHPPDFPFGNCWTPLLLLHSRDSPNNRVKSTQIQFHPKEEHHRDLFIANNLITGKENRLPIFSTYLGVSQ